MYFKHVVDGGARYGECDPDHAPEGAQEITEEAFREAIDAARVEGAEALLRAAGQSASKKRD